MSVEIMIQLLLRGEGRKFQFPGAFESVNSINSSLLKEYTYGIL